MNDIALTVSVTITAFEVSDSLHAHVTLSKYYFSASVHGTQYGGRLLLSSLHMTLPQPKLAI